MTRHRLLPLALLLATPALARPQSAPNATAAGAERAADRALNAQYRAAIGRLPPPARLLLRDAQRGWIGFRDRQCLFEASGVRGGSAYPIVHSECMTRLSGERTRQLRFAATCEEGDLACPR